MGKRRPAFDPNQLPLGLEPPRAPVGEGALGDLPRLTASIVSAILKRDPRNRFEVAAAMGALLDDEVSKFMLDGYSSEARDTHAISFDRMLALAAATGQQELLRAPMRRIGADLLIGEEVKLAEIGHLESQRRQIDQRLRMLKAEAQPLNRGRGR